MRKRENGIVIDRDPIDSLVSFFPFFEDFLASTIFVSHWRVSFLEQIDIWIRPIRRIKENRVGGRRYERDSCENIRNLGAKVA